jgi:hypothetical protein
MASPGDAVGQYASDAWSLAKRTAYGLNEIRKLINIETKVINQSATSTAVNTTGIIPCLSQVAQGLDYTNRVGDSVKIQRLVFRARLYVNAVATTSIMRVLLVRDLDGYGTAPTTAAVLETVAASGAPLSQYNYLNSDRFSVLYDTFVTLSTQNPSEVIAVDMPHEGHIKYLGTTAGATSDGKGSIYMVTVSDEASNTPTIAYNCRIYFTDD